MIHNQQHEFSITKDKTDDSGCHFIVKGQVNALNSAHMEQELVRAVDSGEKNIILDMCLVSFLSSGGIRVILRIQKLINKKGGSLRIKHPSENVKNVIGTIALDAMLLK